MTVVTTLPWGRRLSAEDFFALDVRLSDRTVVEPDLLVVRCEDARGSRLVGVPLLCVEVLVAGRDRRPDAPFPAPPGPAWPR